MENETIRALMERKSVRDYLPDMDETDVQTILRCAVEAPSAGNMTLWSAVRVADPEKKQQLAALCDHQPFIAKAPLVLVFCADYSRWFTIFEDCTEDPASLRRPGEGDLLLAMTDAVIACHAAVTAAEALGYGTCYIGDILENCEQQQALLGLPPYVKAVCMAVIGAPTEAQKNRKKPPRFPVEEVVFTDTYRPCTAAESQAMLGRRQGLEGQALTDWLTAFCKRKWNSAFSEEMTRSARQILQDWREGK